MAKYANIGDPYHTLVEECGEVIQIISKKYRFDGSWDEIPVGKDKTRKQMLLDEIADLELAILNVKNSL